MRFAVFYLILLSFFVQPLCGQARFEYLFQRLSENDGLSGSDVACLLQDHKGYLWIGNFRGLNRYDGYQIKTFKNIPGKGGINNVVSCLEEDRFGNLWIGRSLDRLAILHLSSQRFWKVGIAPRHPIPHSVTALKQTAPNEIWAGTIDGRLFRIRFYFPEKTEDSILLMPEEIRMKTLVKGTSSALIPHSAIRSLIPVNQRDLLIGFSEEGVILFRNTWSTNPKEVNNTPKSLIGHMLGNFPVNCLTRTSNGSFLIGTPSGLRTLKHPLDSQQWITETNMLPKPFDKGVNIQSVVEDNNGNLYLSTELDGLLVRTHTSNGDKWFHYTKQNSTLFSDQLGPSFIDRSNKLWLGTYNTGVTMINLSQKKFYQLRYYPEKEVHTEVKISRIFEDRRRRLWIGTEGDGIYCWNQASDKRIHKKVATFRSYPNSRVNRIMEDHEGNVWFCTHQGLFYLPQDQKFTSKTVFAEIQDNLLLFNQINDIAVDEYGCYWAAINGVLYRFRFDLKNRAILSKTIYNSEKNVPKGCIHFLSLTSKNTLWVGTVTEGMFRITYHGEDDRIAVEDYSTGNHNGKTTSNNNVWWIVSLNDSIWTGSDGGLDLYTPNKSGQFLHRRNWNTADGLLSNEVGGIVADRKGNLWLDTGNGLSKFLTDRQRFVHFSDVFAAQSNSLFGRQQKGELSNGSSERMYFGTNEGLYSFCPEEIVPTQTPPHTKITNLLIYNEIASPEKKINGQVVLQKALPYTDQLYLSYRNNHFTLQFSAFNFDNPLANSYLYRLKGYDDTWRSTYHHEPFVTYSNLPAGGYTFQVMAVNSDGIADPNPAILNIRIGATPWKSVWAWTLYILTLLAIIIVVLKYHKNKIRLKNEVLLEKHKREQEHELAELKSDFYTTISHELRTPLTLISAPLSEINDGNIDRGRLHDLLKLMRLNTEKLLKLTDQMLDFNKTGKEFKPLSPSRLDIVDFLQKICHSFQALAIQKNIRLSFSAEPSEHWTLFDPDTIDKIVSNLIFNALKYTPEQGGVAVQFSTIFKNCTRFCRIQVSDTGIGMEADVLDRIFDKYYQEGHGAGYGIGLFIVKKLVLHHLGTIQVQSRPGKGSLFTVDFPDSEKAFHLYQTTDSPPPEVSTNLLDTGSRINETDGDERAKTRLHNQDKALILVVEDQEDLRMYLSSNLSDKFQIEVASNGKEGLRKAVNLLPDLIVSDIWMPEMDGIAFSSAIKSDERTNHIPFVFLTAKNGEENRLKGLLTGAEDYIMKPFDVRVLRNKIQNLLKLVETNREKQKKQFLFEPYSMDKTPANEDFIEKASRIVRENASNPRFDIDELCRQMAVSRRGLYRKFKESDELPADFIRSIRSQYIDGEHPTQMVKYVGKDAFVRRAAQVVHKHLSDPTFETESFCKELNLSYLQLHRKLKASVNLTATEFIRTLRIKRAAELLSTGNHRVSEVMFEVGFENTSYFAKVFKQQFGKTPKEYLTENKRG